ncbi:MAG: GNAT family N-acetyltransferase [Gemmataceae bacterium]
MFHETITVLDCPEHSNVSQAVGHGPITVQAASLGDVRTIVEFNCRLAAEIDGEKLDHSKIAAAVEAQLREPSLGRYWLAFANGRAVGQLRLWPEWFDWGNGFLLWLDNVYVRPADRRRGVTRALFAHALALASADPRVIGFRLHVCKHNCNARRTYEALGFSVANDVMECRL